jgi:hypothetical protein
MRITGYATRYPVAFAACCAAAIAASWVAYQRIAPPQPAVTTPSPSVLAAQGHRAWPGAARTPSAARGSIAPPSHASALSGHAARDGSAAAQTHDARAHVRADPFQPVVSAEPAPPRPAVHTAADRVPLPPVPSVPGEPGRTGAPALPPQATVPAYQLAGIIAGDHPIAIIEDGRQSYLVQPGDVVAPGIKVAAVSVSSGTVVLDNHGTRMTLLIRQEEQR